MTDIVVIGGGINGLVAAIALARQKFSVLVIDGRDEAGGAAVTTTTPGGFKVPTLSHAIGPLSADVMKMLRAGNPSFVRDHLKFLMPDPVLTTIGEDDQCITFHRDEVLTAASIDRLSPKDAAVWQSFTATMQRFGAILSAVGQHPPPSMDAPSSSDLWRLLGVGRKARALGRRDLGRLARYAPAAVGDVVADWFEHDLVQAAVAVRGVFGHMLGPWSAGTGAILLHRMAEDPIPVGGGVTMLGGPGSLARVLVALAESLGVQIRTGSRVVHVLTRGGTATGVALDTGEEIGAHAVAGAIDPRHLCLDLVDPAELDPTFLQRMRQLHGRGVTAKVNLCLSSRPEFTALVGDEVPLRGRILIAPDVDYVERAFDAAKYGQLSPHPWLEISMPTMNDDALAPEGQHVLSIYVHYAPAVLREGAWADRRDALFRTVMDTIAPYAPGLDRLVIEHEVLTPQDLETGWGYVGGHIFHGDQTLDQWWISRPVLGSAQYASPIRNLYFASAGTHPGGGLTGQPGLNAAREIGRSLKGKRPRI